jgi:hypothetical protein
VVAGVRSKRAVYLQTAIARLLGPLSERFYQHPLIQGLSPNTGDPRLPSGVGRVEPPPNPDEAPPPPTVRKPSYIPARTFALALASLLASDGRAQPSSAGRGAAFPEEREALLANAIRALEDKNGDDQQTRDLKRTLRLFLADADRDLEGWQQRIAQWFDDAMDRHSGWYKRRTKLWLLLYGLLVALALNADSFVFANALWNDSTLRATVVAEAQKATSSSGGGVTLTACASPGAGSEPSASENPFACVAQQVDQLKTLHVPLGWPDWPWRWRALYEGGTDSRMPHSRGGVALKVLGLLVTMLALAQGAPFWFQLLNKVVNLRLTGQPPPRSDEVARGATP